MFGFISFSGSLKEDICMYFPLVSYVKLSPCWRPSWMMDGLQSNSTWSVPHKEHLDHV